MYTLFKNNKLWTLARWIFVVLASVAVIHGTVLAQGLPGPPPPPAEGTESSVDFGSPGRYKDLIELVDAIVGYVFNIAVPIGFGVLIYAGLKFLLAKGNPVEVQKAKDILKYAIIGLAIVFIGRGFVSLIADILGTTAPTP